jgi:hypothetical protein
VHDYDLALIPRPKTTTIAYVFFLIAIGLPPWSRWFYFFISCNAKVTGFSIVDLIVSPIVDCTGPLITYQTNRAHDKTFIKVFITAVFSRTSINI